MSRMDRLINGSGFDIRHIEKHADTDFEQELREYTKRVIMDVVDLIQDCEIELNEEGARDEILFNIEIMYGVKG